MARMFAAPECPASASQSPALVFPCPATARPAPARRVLFFRRKFRLSEVTCPSAAYIGRVWRIPADDLAAWLSERQPFRPPKRSRLFDRSV
jgi:hypothetical protein